MKKKLAAACIGLVAGIGSVPASATLVTLDIDYQITSGFGGFPAPANVSLHVVYDTDAAKLFPACGPCNERALQSASATIDGVAFTVLPTTSYYYFMDQVPFTPPRDRFLVALDVVDQVFNGVTVTFLGLVLEGPETLFSGNAGRVLDPSLFTSPTQAFVAFLNGRSFSVSTDDPSIVVTAELPEPPALALSLAGLLMLGAARRRQRQRG